MQLNSTRIFVSLLLPILLLGCNSSTGTNGVSALCSSLLPVQRVYSVGERAALEALMRDHQVVRKPVEQAVMVKEIYEEHCIKDG